VYNIYIIFRENRQILEITPPLNMLF